MNMDASQSDSGTPREPSWLHDLEEYADANLETGSSCDQVHPIVQQWHDHFLECEPPSDDRDSVCQAMSCLSTEVVHTIPDTMLQAICELFNQDDLTAWVQYVLTVGRAFERGLNNGELDDL